MVTFVIDFSSELAYNDVTRSRVEILGGKR